MAIKKKFTFTELNEMLTFASAMKATFSAASDGHTFWTDLESNVKSAMTVQLEQHFGVELPKSLHGEIYTSNKKAYKNLLSLDALSEKDKMRGEEVANLFKKKA